MWVRAVVELLLGVERVVYDGGISRRGRLGDCLDVLRGRR